MLTSLHALLRLAVQQRLGVFICALATLLASASTASALEPVQTKTRVWGFDLAEHNSSGLFRDASGGKHQGNRLAEAEEASGSLLAAEGGLSRAPNEIFTEASNRIPGQSIRPRNLYRELRRSEIGRETLELIEQTNARITLTPVESDVLGRALGKDISIFVRNTQSVENTAQTVIHEVTHAAGVGGTQRAEIIAEMRALKHVRQPTVADIRAIIDWAKRQYPGLPYK